MATILTSLTRKHDHDTIFFEAVDRPSVGFLKMTWLFEKADRLFVMSRGNIITGLTFPATHPAFRGASRVYEKCLQTGLQRVY